MSNTSIGRKSRVYLGLGSNIGNKESNVARALQLLPEQVTVGEISSIYESEPVGFKDQPWFVNVVCSVYTDLSPRKLLEYLKHIEGQMGRIMSFKNSPRVIDIDILFYGDQIIDTPELIIPHPRIAERAFVLQPLSELDPLLFHPVKAQTVAQLLTALDEPERVKKRKWSALYGKGLTEKPSGTLIEGDAGTS
jgi:2-amino-4-hydroxy-6-hydroxymethyldihydropteridine diphosphokinase